MIELSAPGVDVTVSPHDGGRLASLRIEGHELLVTGTSSDHPMLWGAFPMVPWAGRVAHGRFSFDGETYDLPLDLPPHAIHGTTYRRPWDVADDGSLVVELDWAFGGHAVQRFDLGEHGLTCTIEVHAGDRSMPAQAGWHPWFARPVELRFSARSMYARDDEGIPTGTLVEPTEPPWDDCFTDVVAPPMLLVPGGPTVTLTSTCDHWVVYTEPEHALCVEPQSGPPDAFHGTPYVVLPGQPLVETMTYRWA